MTTATAVSTAARIAANGAVYRTFDISESSAIHNLHIEREGYVEVIFQSNTNRAYGFYSNPLFCEVLTEIISAPNLNPYGLPISLGSLIARNRKNGNLTAIEEAAE